MPEISGENPFVRNFKKLFGISNNPTSQPKINPTDEEPKPIPTTTEEPTNRMQKLAEKTLAELEAIEGRKGLAIVIDDNIKKTEAANFRLKDHGQNAQVGYAVRSFILGDDGIAFYVEVKRISPDTQVVILMDGSLERGDTGTRVTRRLYESTRQNHLPMPYIIGNSSDYDENAAIQKAASDSYLGNFHNRQENPLALFDSKL